MRPRARPIAREKAFRRHSEAEADPRKPSFWTAVQASTPRSGSGPPGLGASVPPDVATMNIPTDALNEVAAQIRVQAWPGCLPGSITRQGCRHSLEGTRRRGQSRYYLQHRPALRVMGSLPSAGRRGQPGLGQVQVDDALQALWLGRAGGSSLAEEPALEVVVEDARRCREVAPCSSGSAGRCRVACSGVRAGMVADQQLGRALGAAREARFDRGSTATTSRACPRNCAEVRRSPSAAASPVQRGLRMVIRMASFAVQVVLTRDRSADRSGSPGWPGAWASPRCPCRP